MRLRKSCIWISLLLMGALSSGCLWAPELDQVRKDIEGQLPGIKFKKEFAVTLGPMSMGLVRMATRFSPETEHAGIYLKDISQVKLAIYKAESVPAEAELKIPERLRRLLEEDGWELGVKVRDGDDRVWLLYRGEGDSIEEIYCVVLDGDELVLVKAKGRLDSLCKRVLDEHVELPAVEVN